MNHFKGQAISWEAKNGVVELRLHRAPCNELGSLSLDELERDYIERVVHETSTVEEASKILGIDPTTLWRKRKKYGL